MTDAITRANALEPAMFTAVFGGVYEHSPWIAEAASTTRPFADAQAMLEAFRAVLAAAPEAAKLALVREHPELARRAGVDPTLTAESLSEQASAGLDRLTPDEYARFNTLNDAYRERFAMPFIICVRLSDKALILSEMARRVENSKEAELETALGEINKIAALRVADVLTTLESPT